MSRTSELLNLKEGVVMGTPKFLAVQTEVWVTWEHPGVVGGICSGRSLVGLSPKTYKFWANSTYLVSELN